MITLKQTLRASCYYPTHKFQQGMVLIWVLFLMLVFASTTAALAKQGYAQLNLISYYDQAFQRAKEIRRIDRYIHRMLSREGTNMDECLVMGYEMQSCDLSLSTTYEWGLYGRELIEDERSSYQSLESRAGRNESSSPVDSLGGVAEYDAINDVESHVVIFKLKNHQGRSYERYFIYEVQRIREQAGTSDRPVLYQVERKLFWADS